jgi:gas vesicle protein
MNDTKVGGRITFLLVGTAIGAVAALLLAPGAGARTRRKIRIQGENAANYLVGAARDLAERCEDVYRCSTELAGDAARELSEKYSDLSARGKQLFDEATAIVSRAVRS